MEEAPSHILVPKHVIASEDEVRSLLESLKKPVESLPIISFDDPGLLGLNARAGDVIRIERLSPVTEKVEPYFRLVVESED